jgi:hypothetical protein
MLGQQDHPSNKGFIIMNKRSGLIRYPFLSFLSISFSLLVIVGLVFLIFEIYYLDFKFPIVSPLLILVGIYVGNTLRRLDDFLGLYEGNSTSYENGIYKKEFVASLIKNAFWGFIAGAGYYALVL